mmetsp:Transcript_39625/g.63529  ORF Transcript_39625/g.63529 Transcript_39625/m.63529 type:complete len:86 (+) Transcript_39625:2-259(+)
MMLVAKVKDEPATYIRSVVSNIVNQPNSLGDVKDSSKKVLLKSKSATGIPERGGAGSLPRLSALKAVDLDNLHHYHPPSPCDVGY